MSTAADRSAAAKKAWKTMRTRYGPGVGSCMSKQANITRKGGTPVPMRVHCVYCHLKGEPKI